MATYKIWLVGTQEVSIEEADSEREACAKTGWQPSDCELQLIPEQAIIRKFEADSARCLRRKRAAKPHVENRGSRVRAAAPAAG